MYGRPKSIHSIWNKMKERSEFEEVYDLFAIRILVNSPLEKRRRLLEGLHCYG
jgi:GTP pyrophosphokinase